jgi:hypothetical protein
MDVLELWVSHCSVERGLIGRGKIDEGQFGCRGRIMAGGQVS